MDIYCLIMEITILYGSFPLTQKVWQATKSSSGSSNPKHDARIFLRYNQAHLQHQREQPNEEFMPGVVVPEKTGTRTTQIINEQILDEDEKKSLLNPFSPKLRALRYEKRFRRRTFKTKGDSDITFDEARLKL